MSLISGEIIEIDGALGEGGGQVLRSSLSLSIITGMPTHITNIRAGRGKPGLRAQHVTAVDAAAAISKAEVDGNYFGSSELMFTPHGIRTGRYKFRIKTAGAASLVLQTIFVPLSMAGSASTVLIRGGTHVSWSPCFNYLESNWLSVMKIIGYDANISLDQAGFYPTGGGRISATIRPANAIKPIQLSSRGQLMKISGVSGVANLPLAIAKRQKRQAILRLQNMPDMGKSPSIRIKTENVRSPGKGTFLVLLAKFEGGQCCFSGLGKLGKPAERVADEAVDDLFDFIQSDGAIDRYLADQLIIPCSLSDGPSDFRVAKITQHLLTNIDIVQAFIPIDIQVDGELDTPGRVFITPNRG
jgi:RNA 3'-terminal phosphate cyclase (ATP)